MSLVLVTAADGYPIDLALAKQQIRRGDVEDDDELLQQQLIQAVTERAEGETHRQLLEATWDLKLDRFPCPSAWNPDGMIELPKPPASAVVSITYVDTNGVTQTLATSEYQVSLPSGPKCRRGRIQPAYTKSWPSTREQLDAVVVRFKAGYGTTLEHVPALLRQGMLMDLDALYDDRTASIPEAVLAIYRSFKSYATV